MASEADRLAVEPLFVGRVAPVLAVAGTKMFFATHAGDAAGMLYSHNPRLEQPLAATREDDGRRDRRLFGHTVAEHKVARLSRLDAMEQALRARSPARCGCGWTCASPAPTAI